MDIADKRDTVALVESLVLLVDTYTVAVHTVLVVEQRLLAQSLVVELDKLALEVAVNVALADMDCIQVAYVADSDKRDC